MKKLVLLSLALAGCNSGVKFDCKEDYCGWVVVDYIKYSSPLVQERIDFIIANGCKYDTVHFPAAYDYALGDTVCKVPTLINVRLEVAKNRAESEAIMKEYDN